MPLSGSYYYPVAESWYSSPTNAANVVQLSSTFLGATPSGTLGVSGSQFFVFLSASDVSRYHDYTFTVINNGITSIKSGNIQVSPNAVNWSTLCAIPALAYQEMFTSSYSNMSYKYARILGVFSGSIGAVESSGSFTGSVDAYVTMNT